MEESSLQRKEIDRRWALTRFQRNPWTAAGECLDRVDPSTSETETSYPTVPVQEVERFLCGSQVSRPEEIHKIPPAEFTKPIPLDEMQWSDIDSDMIAAAVASKRSVAAPRLGHCIERAAKALRPCLYPHGTGDLMMS